MKYLKTLLATFFIACVAFSSNNVVYAAEQDIEYDIEIEDAYMENATVVSSDSYIEDGRLITETVYQLEDGTIIIDTFNRSAISPCSPNGSDTATRTRNIVNWGTITITASFTWYTQGAFSYVKCNSMSATKSFPNQVVVHTWDTSYTSNYVALGKASAQVEYYIYNSVNPTQHQDGTFKITCTDSGTISDNG